MTTGERPKAFSYVRFSTPDQAKGASYDRQIEAAQAYARERGLELAETTYKDLGVSAFRSQNAQTGALWAFLKAVKDGEVPSGSFLLVESIDRLTRDNILEAQSLFGLIINSGITLVTLLDRREYSREKIIANPPELIVSIAIMMRGHEESATKSRRMADVYKRKRGAASAGTIGKPFTKMLPAWLRWSDDKGAIEVIPERAAVIQSVFEKAGEEGWGQHRITQWLNEQDTPTWGGRGEQRKAERWQRSYIKKLLTNSAVVGTFTPHQKQTDAHGKRIRKPLEPVEDYFPAVVGRELFERVANRARAVAPRGRNANTAPASIFAGLLKCGHCGGTVTRVSKGAYVYLVCSRAHRKGGCRYLAVNYRDVEEAFRLNAKVIIRDAPRGLETEELEAEINKLDMDANAIEERAGRLANELIRENSEIVRMRLHETEAEWKATLERLRTLRTQQEALAAPYVRRRLQAIREALRPKAFNVAVVNKTLKEAMSRIVIDPEEGTFSIYWHHAPENPTEGAPFLSRHTEFYRHITAHPVGANQKKRPALKRTP
jgi:DNA invertase Pin-like site-specific DNA recombinase